MNAIVGSALNERASAQCVTLEAIAREIALNDNQPFTLWYAKPRQCSDTPLHALP